MSGRKHILITLGFAAAVGLLASAVSGLLFTYHYSRLQFDLVNVVCGEVVEQEPEARKIVSAALKEFTDGNPDGVAEDDILGSLGYRVFDFAGIACRQSFLYIGAGFLAGVFLIFITFLYRNKRKQGGFRPWRSTWNRPIQAGLPFSPPQVRTGFPNWRMKYIRLSLLSIRPGTGRFRPGMISRRICPISRTR